MKAFTVFTAPCAVYDRPNIDTDLLVPKQFLVRIDRSGFGKYLFHNVRFKDDGSEDQDFFLNQPYNRQAGILLAGENFGCGSSREHAAWALEDYGFRVVVAPSFGDIFRNNAFGIGLLLIELPEETVKSLMATVNKSPGLKLTVDLEKQTISGDGLQEVGFEIAAPRREKLLKGLDDIGLTLQKEEAISSYEKSHDRPWQAALPQVK
ncbi:MAG: 3-isopropylmalate dehydratase small subunit [Deltaproteobacteria bacterium]|jgi:3-isopropylmalate/(R)-2-methylmalate dehydratase small subunit|nr:3-isopropylmalate dehydratase small subunit [Deltaproteobacteria bacterium]